MVTWVRGLGISGGSGGSGVYRVCARSTLFASEPPNHPILQPLFLNTTMTINEALTEGRAAEPGE